MILSRTAQLGGDAGLSHLLAYTAWTSDHYMRLLLQYDRTACADSYRQPCPGHSEPQMKELMSWHKQWIPCLEHLTHALMRTKAWKKQGLCTNWLLSPLQPTPYFQDTQIVQTPHTMLQKSMQGTSTRSLARQWTHFILTTWWAPLDVLCEYYCYNPRHSQRGSDPCENLGSI